MRRSEEVSAGRKGRSPLKDEETVDHGGSVGCGCGPGGCGRLCGGQHHLQDGAVPNGRGQRMPQRGQSQRGRPHHAYGQQIMDVTVNHAPKNTEFELFVTQQPNSPFGVSWYQADFTTNNQGQGEVRARGIFSEELFVFAPGVVKAPQVDDKDAKKNPEFKPVHTFHLGLWFGSPEEADDAGCSDTVTPFDGDHEAGIQAFSTRNFPKLEGPLLSEIQ